MLAELTWRRRKARQRSRALADRLVDLTVDLRIVERDDAGDIPGHRIHQDVDGTFRTVRVVELGGWYDRLAGAFTGTRSDSPTVWYCSENQATMVLHEHPEPWLVMEGAEGGGKSRVGALWLANLMLFGLPGGGAVGATAPTYPRIEILASMVRGYMPPGATSWRAEEHDLSCVTGVTANFRSTSQKTKQGGSPIQGYTWHACLSDEAQDYEQRIEGDILARGRGAAGGVYRRFLTCSAKDSPAWRTWKANRRSLPGWRFIRVTGPENIFVSPLHWSNLKASGISLREWERRALGKDGQPEKATYPKFDRAVHLRPVPHIGAVDVTSRVLRRFGDGQEFAVLVGHDPGKRRHVSELLKCYEIRQDARTLPLLCWWVVGEVETEATTTTEHGLSLVQHGRHNFGVQHPQGGERLLVRADPYSARTQTNDEDHPHRTVYTQLRNLGLTVLAANYAQGKPCLVPKEAGIEMVSSLLGDAQGRVRLYIACDKYGTPVAPKLVQALETQERDPAGRAEWERKDDDDTSHYTAALRYALWALEQVRMVPQAATSDRAPR